ncbi:MAG: MBL fold metallo-hydrolase [Ktedonobacteraceae bacterium]|nr:MBL fold metallo-hydrolase [Ktedonobacteraceae bacterium]
MPAVTQLTPGTWQISLPFLGEQDIIGSYLIAGGNEVAIIDPGPESMMEHLLAAIKEAGFEPRSVTHVLTTHVHLDHAGAVGSLMRHLPEAQVYAHSKGAPHLLDTSKVVASAARIYGERMQSLWGEIEPVPQERLHVMEGGDILNIAGRRLEVHYTPGHAVHHVIFFDAHSGELFAGDVAGVRLQGIDYVRPPTPPPDLDLEAWSESISLLNRLRPDVLYLGHFGPSRNIQQHFTRLREKLGAWGDLVLTEMREGKSEEEITALLIDKTRAELLRVARDEHAIERYEIASNYAMTVQGYMRYWRKRHPERLALA